MNRMLPIAATALCASASFLPSLALADPVATEATRESDGWQFGALIYGYAPSIGGQTTFPNGPGSNIGVDSSSLINILKFAFLGSFEARNGSWGVFTDLMYLNVGEAKSHYRNMTIGNIGLPVDVSASTNFDVKTVLWTVAGTYRAVTRQNAVLDVFAGGRLFDVKQTLDWTLNGNIAQFPLPGRGGTLGISKNFIDGIVGLKGRVAFGTELKWFLPYYGDIGTGDSDLTWQAMGGLGYAFTWGEVIGGWRYIDYKLKSDSAIQSINLDGPMLGVALRW